LTFSARTKFIIYVPIGKVTIETNKDSRFSTKNEFEIKGGDDKILFWRNSESMLREDGQENYDFLYSETLTHVNKRDLREDFVPAFSVNADVSKNEKNVVLTVRLRDRNQIKNVTLNGEQIEFKQMDSFALTKELQFGENEFNFVATNDKGMVSNFQYSYTRLTDDQKKSNEIIKENIEKRLDAEAKAERLRLAEEDRQRQQIMLREEKARRAEAERIAREGDGSNEDKLCQRYGLKPQTNGYAECRMRLDFAKADSLKQQQYEREKAAYDSQKEALQKEREKQRAMRQLELGLRLMGGQAPVDAVNSVGTNAPIAPRAPMPTTQTITLPNGRMVNCTTTGSMTNCN
jgi:hypothetical protein